MGLKKEVKAIEDKLCEALEHEAASREAAVLEVKQQTIDEFKQSKEYKAS